MRNKFKEPLPGFFHITATGTAARAIARWLSGHQDFTLRIIGTSHWSLIVMHDRKPDERPRISATEAFEAVKHEDGEVRVDA